MIGFFPAPYPDELLYSVLARYYKRTGYLSYSSVAKDLFVERQVVPSVELINNLTDDARKKLGNMEEIVLQHTMFPYYSRYIPKERRITAFQKFVDMASNEKANLLPIPQHRGDTERYVRYCPVCTKEMKKECGELYYKRMHQLYGVMVCPVHHCKLIDTPIPISVHRSPNLIPADDVISSIAPEYLADTDVNVRIAEYVNKVFTAPLNLNSDVSVGEYLHTKLAHTKYRSIRGQKRNLTLLSNDMNLFYEDLIQNYMKDYWNITKVLGGRRCGTFDVCMIGMFLGIPPEELTNPTVEVDTQVDDYDKKICSMLKQGYNYRQISKEVGGGYDYVKQVGKKASNRIHSKGR